MHRNILSPYAVGFDHMLERILDQQHDQSATGFPPFNIVKKSDTEFQIQLALAGYKEKDLHIEVKESVLTVTGDGRDNLDKAVDNHYLHRGISARKFVRKFTLADDIIVKNAELDDGLLSVHLERIVPEEKKPRTIQINTDVNNQTLLTETVE